MTMGASENFIGTEGARVELHERSERATDGAAEQVAREAGDLAHHGAPSGIATGSTQTGSPSTTVTRHLDRQVTVVQVQTRPGPP